MIRKYQIAPFGLAAACCVSAAFLSADAHAVQQPTALPEGLHLSAALTPSGSAPGGLGTRARLIRETTSQTPRAQTAAWRRFNASAGGTWLAIWDASTTVPLRIFGSGMHTPNAMTDAAAAARYANDALKEHLDLLAPGSTIGDFRLMTNEVSEGQRVVGYMQTHHGLPVVNGQLSFRFKNDRLFVIASEAVPFVKAKVPSTLVSDSDAELEAQSWVAADFGPATMYKAIEGPFVLPIIVESGVADFHTVLRVGLETKSPIGQWTVYVDAETGQPIAREQTLHFATSALQLNAPERQPLNQRVDFPAQYAQVLVDGQAYFTDAAGAFTFPDGGGTDGEVRLSGPFVRVLNSSGEEAQPTFSFDSDSVTWNDANNEFVDSQITTFVHTQRVKDYANTFANLAWLEGTLNVTVNIDDACNAFYNGQSINFFRSGSQCANTGRIADVVYHEFGHGLHDNAIIQFIGNFDGALSEGVSDYLSATITNDPGMGRGFFNSQAPLRHIDPENGEYRWPENVTGAVHQDGLIIGSTLWDMRKLFIAKYGQAEGVALNDRLFYEAMRRATDIPSMFPEVLAADDDDGDLTNGTPNVCEIVEAFGLHGLRTLQVETADLSVEPPQQDGFDVKVEIVGLYDQCDNERVESATVVWGLQRESEQANTLAMTEDGEGFTASIPDQLAGEVVNYRVEVVLGSGQEIAYPDNAADPMYQFFVGEVTPIYCTDFEEDPIAGGWTHGLEIGNASTEGADDWMWGEPRGTSANGDPSSAYSGSFAFGNDLSPLPNWNGSYQPNILNYAESPVIDASGHANVRLQYRRWLNIEDGYYDKSRIWVNGQVAWANFASPGQTAPEDATVNHTDREWRFHDVDITSLRNDDGTVQVRYDLASDPGLQLGGWTIDDFCIVAYDGPVPGASCGNGTVDTGEECDDGNVIAGDGCDPFCAIEGDGGDNPNDEPTGGLEVSNGCACSAPGDANTPGHGLALIALGAALALRRRR